MKIIILSFILHFSINLLNGQETLPIESIIATQRMGNNLIGWEPYQSQEMKMNDDFAYTIFNINNSVSISPDYDSIFLKNQSSIYEDVLVQYDKSLKVQNVMQIWSDKNILILDMKVFDNQIWIVGKLYGDILYFGNNQLTKPKGNSTFFLCVDEDLKYKSHYFIPGSNSSTIERDGDITYLTGYYNSDVVFGQDTIGISKPSSFLLAVKDDEVLWHRVFEYCDIYHLEILSEGRVLVHGSAFFGLVIDGKRLSEKKANRSFCFAIFNSSGNLFWFQADQTINKVSFCPPNILYFSGWYTDSTVVGDTILYSNNAKTHSSYLGSFNVDNQSLEWVSQFDSYFVSIQKLNSKNEVLTVLGNYSFGDMKFEKYHFGQKEYEQSFIYRKQLNGSSQMFKLHNFSSHATMLDVVGDNILVGEEFYWGMNLSMIYTNKLNEFVGMKQSTNEFEIFPNPIHASEYLKIVSKFESGDLNIKLVNNLGQIIFTNHDGKSFQIPANLQSGIYYLMIEDDERSEVHKLVVE